MPLSMRFCRSRVTTAFLAILCRPWQSRAASRVSEAEIGLIHFQRLLLEEHFHYLYEIAWEG